MGSVLRLYFPSFLFFVCVCVLSVQKNSSYSRFEVGGRREGGGERDSWQQYIKRENKDKCDKKHRSTVAQSFE